MTSNYLKILPTSGSMALIIHITLVTTVWFTQRKRNKDKLTRRGRRKFYSGLSWKSDCVISVISFFHFFLFISLLPCSLILLKNTAATGSVYTGMGCVKLLTHPLQQFHEVCNSASSEKVEPLSSSRAGPQSLCQAIESPRVVLESAASDSLENHHLWFTRQNACNDKNWGYAAYL